MVKNAVKNSQSHVCFLPDRNNVLYGHKGKYLSLYMLFDMQLSDLVHIIQSLASGQRRKQLLALH